MEPVFMILGQSAGTAAALAIDAGVAVQNLDYAKLKAKLESDKQRLVWQIEPAKQLAGLVVDDAAATTTGVWTSGTLTPVCGLAYLHDGNNGKGEKTVAFEVKVPEPGDYELKLLYIANPNRSSKTPVTVAVGEEHTKIFVNQRKSGGKGQSLGSYRIEDFVTVTVSNQATDGFVVVDGVQLLPKP